jgi:Uma2 family endonuclease
LAKKGGIVFVECLLYFYKRLNQITMTANQEQVLPEKISWEMFQKEYLSREDNFKYEWVNGQVEKTERSMNRLWLFIQVNLMKFLAHLKAQNLAVDGILISGGDVFFAGNHRRPDIAYFTDEQIDAARYNADIHPDFVIEVISKNDQLERVAEKMENYRKAEVAVVWHVFPTRNEVHVYRGRQMSVCTGEDLCSAEPVIPGFVISVNEVFR